MATKTISLELDAYERLKQAKRSPRESFSAVVRRARWDGGDAGPGSNLLVRLTRLRAECADAFLDEEALDAIERRVVERSLRTRPRGG